MLTHMIAICQCDYNVDNLSHVNCHGDNTGSIDISIFNLNSFFWWEGPNGFVSYSKNLQNLIAGKYRLTIIENIVPGDTTTTTVCKVVDSITILQTLPITASFELSNMCSLDDSVDVKTKIIGGTPPYLTIWSTGDTSRNTTNLAPNPTLPYVLTISDANFCSNDQYLTVPFVLSMNTFMSSVGEICKDDYSGSARIFVTNGTPPFKFVWDIMPMTIFSDDSSSEIENLNPGQYIVEVTDDLGCIIYDTVEVLSNPKECITIYKAFSPNDDEVNEFWQIENIHLYPKALIMVFDRNGREVFRRRNYQNSEDIAFSGKDKESRVLPSGTYYYVINLENGDQVLKGTVTILR